jgi:cytochrome c-type biogenesis protein CcmF
MTNLDAAGKINLVVSELDEKHEIEEVSKEVLSIEASIKPFINLVWLGVFVMVVGFIFSTLRRTQESKK